MNKLFPKTFFLLLAIILFFLPVIVHAQDTEEFGVGEIQEVVDPALKLELSKLPQEYPTKSIPIEIKITSEIDSGKVGIEWEYPKTLFVLEGPATDIVSVTEGNVTTFVKYFTPKSTAIIEDGEDKIRIIEIGARVNAFQPDRNYLSATAMTFSVDAEMEVSPIDSSYQRTKVLSTGFTWFVRLSIVTVVIVLIIIGFRKFTDYLNSDDEEV